MTPERPWPEDARDELDAWEDKFNDKYPDRLFSVVSIQHHEQWVNKCAALESKIAKAVEALEEIERARKQHRPRKQHRHGAIESTDDFILRLKFIARTIRAMLKGETR